MAIAKIHAIFVGFQSSTATGAAVLVGKDGLIVCEHGME
jgi:hypothetical protein